MEEFFNYIGSGYIWIAGILALFSFLIINKGVSVDAKKTEANINDRIVSAVNKSVKQTKQELDKSTEILKENTESAIIKITNATKELAETLNLINGISKRLENNIENQELLVQCKYTFISDLPDSRLDQDFFGIMKFILTENNFYFLRLTSKNSTTEFYSDNNDFQTFSEYETGYLFGQTFINGIYNNEINMNIEEPSAQLEVNYKLNLIKADFLIEDLQIGDEINFSILRSKNMTREEKIAKLGKAYYKINASFFNFDEMSQGNKAKNEMSLLLKDGRVLHCTAVSARSIGDAGAVSGVEFITKIRNIELSNNQTN